MPQNLARCSAHFSRLAPALLLGGLAACTDKQPVEPAEPGTPTTVTLNLFGVATVPGSAGVRLAAPGRYAVLPQFAATRDFATGTNRATVADFAFTIGGSSGITARLGDELAGQRPALSVVEAFHLRLREIEREEAPRAIAFMRARREAPTVNLQVSAQTAATTRDFRVLSSLTANTYATVTARLLFNGTNILLYVDAQSPATGAFTDSEYASFGRQFDQDLFPIDVAAFGATSDIDSNGKTFVLFTPIVNRLTLNSGACGSYVAGFFNGADLSGSSNGNRAEIFYSSVPGEPAGGATCTPLRQDIVRNSASATFIHELQHMISYNQHVLARNAATEDVWLNEGLSHMAEELGGKLYEARYPCPNLPPCPGPGRGSPSQIFPDSAQGFLPPNFGNAYEYFSQPRSYSLTSPTGFGTIEERGVAWLFLRWLADQKGDAKLRELVQTRNVGTANIEAVAGEKFRTLYADFLAAVLLDDFVGATSGQISSRHQFSSRNLRAIYARLNLINASQYPTAYPLAVANLGSLNQIGPSSAAVARQMKPGSMDLFQYTAPTANTLLAFGPSSGSFLSTLNAQVTVVRLPGN